MRTSFIAAITIFVGFIAIHGPAHAAGSESTGESEVASCEKGQVYNEETKECVKADEQSLNDDQLLQNGIALAYAQRFDEAVAVLSMISNPNTPEVQNYLGFASRSAGDLETGLKHYRTALALDPDYTLARSYMGQALLIAGDRRGALMQLDEIERRVGMHAREYKLLASALLQKSLGKTITY